MADNRVSVLGDVRSARLILGAVLLIISLLALIVISFVVSRESSYDKKYIAIAGELRVLSQRIAKNATEAASGTASAYSLLRSSRTEFQQELDRLQNGNPDEDLPPAPENASAEIIGVNQVWTRVGKNTDVILKSEKTVQALYQVLASLGDASRMPNLQEQYNQIVKVLLARSAPADQIATAHNQASLASSMVGNLKQVQAGGEGAVKAADTFGKQVRLFDLQVKAMLEGNRGLNISRVTTPEAVQILNAIDEQLRSLIPVVERVVESSPELSNVRSAANEIFADSQNLLRTTSDLATRLDTLSEDRLIGPIFGYIFGLLAVGSIFWMAIILYQDTKNRMRETQSVNEQNQNAIMRLLDELADLAHGDLTVTATVSEDFTGAIADSINYTIDQLRILVSTINGTAVSVSSAAQETQATAMHLAEASEHQAQEIAGASAAINEMAVSIDQVSSNALESASVAERSVSIAKKGNEVVKNTINGMDTIREQIQETSKRIKRLGESSQEIGDIVSLINDIADQTNILALNAAIQASMAGDAGRGFAVVADEVQRLAERSSAATKQIEALVKTIQSDTNEAVISMEQTTSEVVRGARLAQDAGVALEEIESVSANLAELIQNISNAARQQAASAGHVSNTMNVIQEITSQTSAGTNATASSIGNLASLASEMRNSVAGFKLPDASR